MAFIKCQYTNDYLLTKELTELGTGRSQFVRVGVQRVQPFVHGYRECNIPVQVKGGSLAQLSGVSPLSTGYYLILLDAESRKESASLHFSPVGETKKKRRNSCEINKTQWASRKEWRL